MRNLFDGEANVDGYFSVYLNSNLNNNDLEIDIHFSFLGFKVSLPVAMCLAASRRTSNERLKAGVMRNKFSLFLPFASLFN